MISCGVGPGLERQLYLLKIGILRTALEDVVHFSGERGEIGFFRVTIIYARKMSFETIFPDIIPFLAETAAVRF